MEGRLKKIGNEYKLYAQDDSCIATSWHSPYQRLSKKNCDAIENGYDLDDLADEIYFDGCDNTNRSAEIYRRIFKEGFQKALEILGDKKFSEKDMMQAIITTQVSDSIKNNDDRLELIQSLQQTEWDCIVEMEQDYLKWKQSDIEDIKDCLVPKLDAEGCLILKRK